MNQNNAVLLALFVVYKSLMLINGTVCREIDEISSKRRQQENQAITVESNHCDISQKLDQLAASFESSKRDFGHVHVSVVWL